MGAFKRNILTFGITFCISFLLFGITAYILMSMFFGPGESSDPLEAMNPDDMLIGFDSAVGGEAEGGSSFSILLVGTDAQSKVKTNADAVAESFLLVKYSCETESVIYVSIPAITKTVVNGTECTLGQAYKDKGIEYVMEKVQGMTGLQVNYYSIANVDALISVYDSLGGIEYAVPTTIKYEDPANKDVIDLKVGEQQLDGKKVVALLRYSGDSYSSKVHRHAQFYRAVFEKYTQASYRDQATSLYYSIFKQLNSNFQEKDILKHVDTIYKYPTYESKIIIYPGEYAEDDSYFIAKEDEALKTLSKYKNY